MRMLHVVWSLASGEVEKNFLEVLRHVRREDASIEHHVLAFAGGPLEAAYRDVAHEVTIGCDQQTIEQFVGATHGSPLESFDLVHIPFERCADRLLPQLVARSAVPVVYGRGYDRGAMYRPDEGLRWCAEEAMLAACDAATFTSARLALAYDVSAGHTSILGDAAELPSPSAGPDADPLRVIARRLLHALQAACAAGPYWRAVDQ